MINEAWKEKRRDWDTGQSVGRSGGPHFDILDGFSEAQWGADCGSCLFRMSFLGGTLPKIGGTSYLQQV